MAEVEFREWTRGGSLRQPSYKGLREDKAPEEVVREDQRSGGAGRRAPAGGATPGAWAPVSASRSSIGSVAC